MALPEPTRVRDTRTGHEYTTRYVLDGVHEPLDDQPATDRNGRFLDAVYADAPPADDTDDDTAVAVSYEQFTVEQLRDAIKARNEGRPTDDLIPATGNKADLVAALQADDARPGTAGTTTPTDEGTPS